MPLRRFIGTSCLFLTIFLLCAFALNAALRSYGFARFDLGRMDVKLQDYLAHYADSDIVFIGTSRTDRQVDIPEFQKEMRRTGCPAAQAYNLGVPNLTYEEMLYVLERIRAAAPRLIVLEEPIYAQHEWRKIETDRLRFFSTWEGTALRLRNIWSYQEDIPRKIYRTGVALAALLYEQTSPGHISRFLFPQAGEPPEPELLTDLMHEQRGYVSMDRQAETDENISALRRRFEQEKTAFAERLAKTGQEDRINGNADARAALIEEITKSIRPSQSLILFPPLEGRAGRNRILSEALRRRGIDVLNTNDPSAYPQFFTADAWYDAGHLNARSSAVWSSALAAHICPLLKKEEP